MLLLVQIYNKINFCLKDANKYYVARRYIEYTIRRNN